MKLQKSEKILVLGGSRGLGLQIFQRLKNFEIPVQAMSRKSTPAVDFSKEVQWENILEKISIEKPTRIFYCAGGGPHGKYSEKAWKDHLWSYRVNFLFPSFLISYSSQIQNLKQLIFVGSAVAETHPDPLAASYAAGKSGLRNLILSILAEGGLPSLDLRLFSPGYMDTELLPPNAWPRRQEGLVKDPAFVAKELIDWVQSTDDTKRHLVLP